MKWKYFSMVTKVSHHYKKNSILRKSFIKRRPTHRCSVIFFLLASVDHSTFISLWKRIKVWKRIDPPPLCICKRQTNNKFGQRYLLLSKLFRATWERRHQYNLLIQSHVGKENEKVWAMFNPKKSSKVVKIKLIRLTVTSITTAPPLTVRNQKNQYL